MNTVDHAREFKDTFPDMENISVLYVPDHHNTTGDKILYDEHFLFGFAWVGGKWIKFDSLIKIYDYLVPEDK